MQTRPRSLACVANDVAQELSVASQNPRGLSPLDCARLAYLLDEAMVIDAPIAPPPVVVPICWGKGART